MFIEIKCPEFTERSLIDWSGVIEGEAVALDRAWMKAGNIDTIEK